MKQAAQNQSGCSAAAAAQSEVRKTTPRTDQFSEQNRLYCSGYLEYMKLRSLKQKCVGGVQIYETGKPRPNKRGAVGMPLNPVLASPLIPHAKTK
jgi:hypothetical protein